MIRKGPLSLVHAIEEIIGKIEKIEDTQDLDLIINPHIDPGESQNGLINPRIQVNSTATMITQGQL